MDNAFRDIADMIKVPGCQVIPRESVVRIVKLWLEDPANGPWLVVFDDFAAEVIYGDPENGSASLYHLPRTASHGYVIVTARSHSTAALIAPKALYREVPILTEIEACELLKRRLRPSKLFDSEKETAQRLVKKLDQNPSAIVLAAAYVSKRQDFGESLSTYLATFKDASLKCLFSSHSLERLKDLGLTHSPILAWQTTFSQIKSQKTIDLFSLMSCFERTSISISLLGIWIDCPNNLRDHLEALHEHMLITSCKSRGSCAMPSLVQLIARQWLHEKGSRTEWQCNALRVLFKKYEAMATDTSGSPIQRYVQQRSLLPHVDVFVRYYADFGGSFSPEILTELTPAFVSFAMLYAGEGRYGTAMKLLSPVSRNEESGAAWKIKALKLRAEIIRAYPSRKKTSHEARKGDLKAARDFLKKARLIAQSIHSENEEIEIEACLALNYSESEKFKLAEKCQGIVVKYRQEHPEFLGRVGVQPADIQARLALARIYFHHGRYSKSHPECTHLDHFIKAREIQEQLLKELKEEPQSWNADEKACICEVQAALARTYYAQEELDKAADTGREAYRGRAELFGEYDLKTLGVVRDLALCLCRYGEADEAMRLFGGARERLVKRLGRDHYEVRKCDEQIAWVAGVLKEKQKQDEGKGKGKGKEVEQVE